MLKYVERKNNAIVLFVRTRRLYRILHFTCTHTTRGNKNCLVATCTTRVCTTQLLACVQMNTEHRTRVYTRTIRMCTHVLQLQSVVSVLYSSSFNNQTTGSFHIF